MLEKNTLKQGVGGVALLEWAAHTCEQTQQMAYVLGTLLAPGHIIGLIGELGAGKTHFAKAVAAGLGIGSEVCVSSPTFTLANEYQGRIPFYHLDLYRLNDQMEMHEAGIFDYLESEGAVLIEWFDRLEHQHLAEKITINIDIVGETSRSLYVRAEGPRHRLLLERWQIDCAQRASTAPQGM